MSKFKNIISLGKLVSVLGLIISIPAFTQDYMEDGRLEERITEESTAEKVLSKMYLGVGGGVNSPVGDMDTSAEVRVNVGYYPIVSLGVGLEMNTTELEDAGNNTRTNLLLNGAYRVGGDIPVIRTSYISVGAGPVFDSSKSDEWAVAPTIGFDIPLSSRVHNVVSLGLNARYVGISNTDDSYVGSAEVKYWF